MQIDQGQIQSFSMSTFYKSVLNKVFAELSILVFAVDIQLKHT